MRVVGKEGLWPHPRGKAGAGTHRACEFKLFRRGWGRGQLWSVVPRDLSEVWLLSIWGDLGGCFMQREHTGRNRKGG